MLIRAIALLLVLTGCTSQAKLMRWYVQSVDAQRTGQLELARRGYEQLLAEDPGFEGANNNLAILQFRADKPTNGLNSLQKELKLRPTLRAARLNEVIALTAAKDKRAVPRAQEFTAAHPKDGLGFLALGTALAVTKAAGTHAEAALAQAIQLGPEAVTAQALFQRGQLRASRQAYVKAAADFTAVSKLRRDAIAHYNRGLALTRAGQYRAAVDALKLAAALDPDAAAIAHAEALAQSLLKDDGATLSALSRAAKLEPRRSGLRFLAGLVYMEKKDWPKAAMAFQQELQVAPKASAASFNLGLVQVELGDLKAARRAFARAVELDPSDDAASKNRNLLAKMLEDS